MGREASAQASYPRLRTSSATAESEPPRGALWGVGSAVNAELGLRSTARSLGTMVLWRRSPRKERTSQGHLVGGQGSMQGSNIVSSTHLPRVRGSFLPQPF
jgi:hypothetical protein